ncbi:unnamed protein product [Chondrus crispus]|uniref:Glycosyltransferase 61 catalytic domain-containing protein n=1 Tax=Chondrus crispus TaxID=2769 RepID=R7QQY6_CHOCR|nr:unnamed protein product [Chondrus crispus]CDF40519.1 unnamed protein product [Chondrus crispus]|eukprot:XP_005710813.1 unnamed protein product [Chondrus crispus]
MAAEHPHAHPRRHLARPFSHLLRARLRPRWPSLKSLDFVSPRLFRFFGLLCLLACFAIAERQFRLITSHHRQVADREKTHILTSKILSHQKPLHNDDHDLTDQNVIPKPFSASEKSVHLWRRIDHDLPPEQNPPDSALYGTGTEKCFSLGLPDAAKQPVRKGDPAAFWQMNSRAMCYSPNPVCLSGGHLDHFISFEPRGSGSCNVLAVEKGQIIPGARAGLNESCAAWRWRQVVSMYGKEHFTTHQRWTEAIATIKHPNPRHHPVEWLPDFAIIVPKYPWSYNICHYNRIWNYVLYVIKNLNLFVPDADEIKNIHVLFRSGFNYHEQWHVGIRNATLPLVMEETGKQIHIGKLRYDPLRDFRCWRRGIVLGREARIDAFPFLNDTPVWRPEQQLDDSHWPVIPHDSLWLREAVMKAFKLPSIGKYDGPGIRNFVSLRVPPLRVGILQRSPRSRRRLAPGGKGWFESTLRELCEKHGMELVHVHTSGTMNLGEQVRQVKDLGMAVGLHGANMVNTMFIPAGGAMFEIFPWRYVRFYYAGGGNSGLRYSFHEPEGGKDMHCSFEKSWCFMKYREARIFLTRRDKETIRSRLDVAMGYIKGLHRRYPDGSIPLRREGGVYHFDK